MNKSPDKEKEIKIKKAKVQHLAPPFNGCAWDCEEGFINVDIAQFKGKYLVLFFYPMDFTFVCPTEILEFERLFDKFKEINCALLAVSCDTQYTHMEFAAKKRTLGGLENVRFPLLADVTKNISRMYRALVTDGKDEGVCFRATYIIDDKQIIRHMTIGDLPVGRNAEEVLRLVQAFQHADKYGEVCPSGWKKGTKGIIPNHEADQTKKYFASVK